MEKREILQIFREYVYGSARLNDLEDWVLSHLQAILNSGNQEAIALIDQVDALLVEIGEGVASEEELFNTIFGFISDADTVEREFTIKPSEICVLSIEESKDDLTIQQAEFEFYPQSA